MDKQEGVDCSLSSHHGLLHAELGFGEEGRSAHVGQLVLIPINIDPIGSLSLSPLRPPPTRATLLWDCHKTHSWLETTFEN